MEEKLEIHDVEDMVTEKHFKPNMDAIQTIDDIKAFFTEMGLGVVLYGSQTLEEAGRDPKWWVEVTDTGGEPIQ
jgi:hypothetical protein